MFLQKKVFCNLKSDDILLRIKQSLFKTVFSSSSIINVENFYDLLRPVENKLQYLTSDDTFFDVRKVQTTDGPVHNVANGGKGH